MSRFYIKSKEEIKRMKEAGKRHAQIISSVHAYIDEGMSTYDIELFVRREMKKLNVKPIQIGYHGYPLATCIGINDDGLHCIPRKDKIIENGDILTFDSVIKYNGYCADGGFTKAIGKVDEEGLRLISINKKALETSIQCCIEGNTLGDLGYAVSKVIEGAGFNTLKGFVGHGIGRNMHEDPQIPNYGIKGEGLVLKSGMTLALDTMVAEGSGEIEILDDGWSTRMVDGKRLSFYEHTVLVGKTKAEVLTKY